MSNDTPLLDPAADTVLAEPMPEEPGRGDISDFVAYPFPMVDAALDRFLRREFSRWGITVQRQQQTSGSVGYFLRFKDPEHILVVASVEARMVGDQATRVEIHWSWNSGLSREVFIDYLEYLRSILALFTYRLTEENLHAIRYLKSKQDAQAADLAPPLPDPAHLRAFVEGMLPEDTPSKRGGPYSWPEDDWAWEQVNVQKQPRRKVRVEWESRLSPDRPRLQDMDRSFRHAVSARRKPETPEG